MLNTTKGFTPNRILFAVFIFALASVAVAAVIANSHPVATKPAGPPVAKQTTNQPNLVIIYATPYGFDPDEITIPAGPTAVVIRNQTGLKASQFRLSKTGPTTEVDDIVKAGRGESPTFVKTLGAGEFVLREDSTPDQLCRLRIQ